ncbi:hypothetical protein B5K06_31445 [Rhizobium grahamii]|uniref:DUF411 domain-containing protein n=2 Tax=Rhizobium grahamii TaxID=1120045 RepID=A0A370KFB1_9HYPH|nr:hypothetical protein B5K06_31445 [Rhizobium grahamii]
MWLNPNGRKDEHAASSFYVPVTGVVAFVARSSTASQVRMDIYKDPDCGCRGAWAAVMVDSDFNVVVRAEDFIAIKVKLGIPEKMQGCHTAVVGDYFFEGHVPLGAVERLLNEKSAIAGLAVPGMPRGSLGMGDDPTAAFEVYSLNRPDMEPSLYMRMGS